MTYFLLRDYSILPQKELHVSPWVDTWNLCAAFHEGTDLKVEVCGLKRASDPGRPNLVS